MAVERIWEVEVAWSGAHGDDSRATELAASIAAWLGCRAVEVRVRDLYWIRGRDGEEGLDRGAVEEAGRPLLSDPVTQLVAVRDTASAGGRPVTGREAASALPDKASAGGAVATILARPGVMDPVEASLRRGLADLGHAAVDARRGRRVLIGRPVDAAARRLLAERVLANPAIEDVYWDDDPLPSPFAAAHPYRLEVREVPLEGLDDEALLQASRDGMLSLDLDEMRAIRDHFAAAGRAPREIELETIAQTWSEHCCHKTLTAAVEHRTPGGETVRYENLLRDTIGRATRTVDEGRDPPFCLSVFRDNAGVVAFDDEHGLTFKVETHNHPSAIEPYGGAGTGIGGVLRDTLGTGLGAKPIVNTDVFCVGPPDLPPGELPPGTLHPRRVLEGVVAGVRDYGNRMGIPTASGGIWFDPRYTTNPLVYAGSVGVIPRWAVEKEVRPGDRVVLLGGRTGRDGIHGATFSSVELTEESERVSSGAVQIGNPITEKKVLDVLLAARDRRLYRSVTDCGAGGLSSAVGEMGAPTGARVELDRVPLKYEGLSHWEIWISEAQERMVLAVPPERLDELGRLAAEEDVECTDIGEFTGDGTLVLRYEGAEVGRLDMGFLHEGRPPRALGSVARPAPAEASSLDDAPPPGRILRSILAAPDVASKEWVIRQYDHEVQGRSVLKPLQGPREGPGDGVAFTPVLGSLRGVVVGCGMNPRYGDLDTYRMATAALDEAVRNAVAAGGDPDRIAVLDNFSWGRTDTPETLGTMVEAARGCHDAAVALGTPFISGKDSLNNTFRAGGELRSIPPSLLVSSIAVVDDVRQLVSMDLKAPGRRLVLVGSTRRELGGSHLLGLLGRGGGVPPALPEGARAVHRGVHRAIREGLVRAAHDLSEGGLAVAAAEMALAGGLGAEIRLAPVPRDDGRDAGDDLVLLFAESCSRYLLEVEEADVSRLLDVLGDVPAADVGETLGYRILRVVGRDGTTVLAETVDDLEAAWRGTLERLLGTSAGAAAGPAPEAGER